MTRDPTSVRSASDVADDPRIEQKQRQSIGIYPGNSAGGLSCPEPRSRPRLHSVVFRRPRGDIEGATEHATEEPVLLPCISVLTLWAFTRPRRAIVWLQPNTPGKGGSKAKNRQPAAAVAAAAAAPSAARKKKNVVLAPEAPGHRGKLLRDLRGREAKLGRLDADPKPDNALGGPAPGGAALGGSGFGSRPATAAEGVPPAGPPPAPGAPTSARCR